MLWSKCDCYVSDKVRSQWGRYNVKLNSQYSKRGYVTYISAPHGDESGQGFSVEPGVGKAKTSVHTVGGQL